MENKLVCKPIMLLTEDINAPLFLHTEHGVRLNRKYEWANYKQHLHLVSEGEIRGGDYYIDTISLRLSQSKGGNPPGVSYPPIYKKVEATTDKSLGLPLIPQSFIEEYVQKQGKIDKVQVDAHFDGYVLVPILTQADDEKLPTLYKVLPVKDSFTRGELKKAMLEAAGWGMLLPMGMRGQNADKGHKAFDEWFDKNY